MKNKKATNSATVLNLWLKSGDPVWIQTRNLLIRSQMLYSIELQGHFFIGIAKINTLTDFPKNIHHKLIEYRQPSTQMAADTVFYCSG